MSCGDIIVYVSNMSGGTPGPDSFGCLPQYNGDHHRGSETYPSEYGVVANTVSTPGYSDPNA